MTYLEFVTLNTGSTDRIAPPDKSLTHAAAMDLARALRHGQSEIGGHPGYMISAQTVGSALLCSVSGEAEQPIVTFGVAARSRSAARLWDMIHDTSRDYNLMTSPDQMPGAPWCAVRIEPGLLRDSRDAWRWLPAYEIEIATAWIERRHLDA